MNADVTAAGVNWAAVDRLGDMEEAPLDGRVRGFLGETCIALGDTGAAIRGYGFLRQRSQRMVNLCPGYTHTDQPNHFSHLESRRSIGSLFHMSSRRSTAKGTIVKHQRVFSPPTLLLCVCMCV